MTLKQYLFKKLEGQNITSENDLKMIELPTKITMNWKQFSKNVSNKFADAFNLPRVGSTTIHGIKKQELTDDEIVLKHLYDKIQSLNYPSCFDYLGINIATYKSKFEFDTAITLPPIFFEKKLTKEEIQLFYNRKYKIYLYQSDYDEKKSYFHKKVAFTSFFRSMFLQDIVSLQQFESTKQHKHLLIEKLYSSFFQLFKEDVKTLIPLITQVSNENEIEQLFENNKQSLWYKCRGCLWY